MSLRPQNEKRMKKQIVDVKDWGLYFEGKKFKVDVPGDIVKDLMKYGILPDAMFGDNYKQAAWVHDRDWVYEGVFSLDRAQTAAPEIILAFECVDTFAEISLNGQVVGTAENMFRRYTFDIRSLVRAGENVLTVKIFSIREREKSYKNEKYTACFNDERLFIRKSQCHFGWDWAPNFPGTGIVGGVSVSLGERGGIANVRVNTSNDGAIGFIVETTYNNRGADRELEGDTLVLEMSAVPFGGTENGLRVSGKVIGSKNLLNLYLAEPALWYPNGYGEQPLYSYKVTLERGGKVIDEMTGRFGIRTVEVREAPLGARERRFDIYVNGKRFRAIGSNWVPCDIMTGLSGGEKYLGLLKSAKSAGINMLRVWGGGLYEKDVFYDLCDEYGIMIWQDFMFSCGAVPDDIPWFRDVIEREATEQIVRLRNHPCVGVWCGGNELTDCFRIDFAGYGKYIIEVMLPGLCYELDGTRKYVWDSPYSLTDIGNDASSGDCHNNALAAATAHDDIAHYRKYQWGNENNFDSECAVLGMCRLRSFKKFMPKDKLWPQNELWEERLACNPYDDSVVSFTTRINMTVKALFGEADGLEDYIKKSMTAHAEVLTDEINYYRSFERNSGLLNWMYDDIWGNGTWAIVDFYGEKKPAYYAMKRAGKRRRASVVFRKEGYFLSVVNDSDAPWKGTLDFSQRELSGKVLFQRQIPFSVAPFGQILLPAKFDEDAKQAYLRLEADGDVVTYFYDLWKDKTFVTDISTQKKVAGNRAELVITAGEYARCVFVDLPDGVQAELSDNYFDIPKGESRLVTVEADRPLREEDLVVKTFADVWDD